MRRVTDVSGAAPVITRRIYLANLVAQMAIIVTGAIVRLTGSGLGCPTWPECIEGSYTPTARQEQEWHKWVEFGNRLLTFVLVILAIAAIVVAILDARRRRRADLPARPVLLVLATVPILGTVAQAILGGITVLTGLHPATVSAHFLASIAIVAGCAALVVRSADEGDAPPVFLVRREIRILSWLLIAVTAVMVVLGVLVTGSGPYSGDANAENRYSFDPRMMSWLHADSVLLFLGLTVGLLIALYVSDAPARAIRSVWVLLVVSLVQGVLGYVQYFTGEPVLLVAIHVLGAVVVWTLALLIIGPQRTRAARQPI